MANPLVAFGIIFGIIAGLLAYKYKKKWWLVIVIAVVTFLGVGTPAHFAIVPALIGVLINKLLYKYIKINWVSLLVSLPGVFLIVGILAGTGKLYLKLSHSGPVGIGEAIGIGVAMGIAYALFILMGIISYVIATLVTSICRWIKNRKN